MLPGALTAQQGIYRMAVNSRYADIPQQTASVRTAMIHGGRRFGVSLLSSFTGELSAMQIFRTPSPVTLF
jgi:hypothetical protein